MSDINNPALEKYLDMVTEMSDSQYDKLSEQLYQEVHKTPEGQPLTINEKDTPEMKIFKEYHNSSLHQENALSAEIKSVMGNVSNEEVSQLSSAFDQVQQVNPDLSFEKTMNRIKHMRETNDPALKANPMSSTPKFN